jgi:hypothetical protein
VPSNTILEVHPEPAATWVNSGGSIEDALQKRNLMSPKDLLEFTRSTRINEVLLTGKNPFDETERVQVNGVFLVVDANGTPLAGPAAAEMWEKIARSHNLPTVHIPEPSRPSLESLFKTSTARSESRSLSDAVKDLSLVYIIHAYLMKKILLLFLILIQ